MPASENELYKVIGELVRTARERAGWTQNDLARLAGLTRTSITNLESGNQKLRVHTLFNIAQALGVSPETLLPLPNKRTADEIGIKLDDKDLNKTELEWVKRILDDTQK